MPKFHVYGKVTGSRYMGEFEAESRQEAMEKADSEIGGAFSLCHQCSGKVEDAEVEAVDAELVNVG